MHYLLHRSAALPVAILFAMVCGNSWAQDPAPVARKATFDIASQPLADALTILARQSGLNIILTSQTAATMLAPALSGSYTPDEALKKLLAPAGLKVEYLDGKTVAVRAADESAGRAELGERNTGLLTRLAQSNQTEKTVDSSAQKSSASAEQDSGAGNHAGVQAGIQEIVVTAQKREQSAKDVPMSITALSGETLERRHLTDLQSLSFAVPGLTAYDVGGGRLSIAIRGIDNTLGSTSLTGMYMDEVPLAGSQGGYTPMYPDIHGLDIERLEVLKGPQGTLFGEGAVGGVIRYITNKPDLTATGGRVSATFYGTQDGAFSGQALGVLNVPLIDDVLGIRVAGTYGSHGGWIDNVGTGKDDFNDSKIGNVRSMILWKPTDKLAVTGLAQVNRNYGDGNNIVDLRPYESSRFVQAYDAGYPTDFSSRSEIFNLTVNYDLGFASLLSSTSYLHVRSDTSFTAYVLGNPPAGITRGLYEIAVPHSLQRQDIASQELRLTSSSPGPFKWTLGGQYKEDKFDSTFDNTDLDAIAVVLYGLVTVRAGGNGLVSTNRSRSWAAFGDASYTFLERLEVGAGIREYIDDRKNYETSGYAASGDFSKLTYRAYTRYAATENVNLYLNVSTGFRSGGFTGSVAISRGAAPTYDPETAIFYEVGAKTKFPGGRAALDLAVFEGNYEDQLQAFQSVSTVTGQVFSYTVNAGDAKIRGVEWQLDLLPLDDLTLSFGGNLLDTEFTKVSKAAVVFLGDPLPRTPKYVLQASANYRLNWTPSVPGSIDVSYNRKGKAEAIERTNSFGPKTAASRPLDMLQVSLVADWKDLQLILFGRNLLDERDPLIPSLLDSVSQARPRSFGLTLSKAF